MTFADFSHVNVPVSTRQNCRVGGRMSVGKGRTTVRESRTEVAERVIAFLREIYPSKTAENVALDIGCSAHAVEKWLTRESAPSMPTFGLLAMVYGPEFVSRAFPKLTWLDPVVRKRMTEKLEAEIEERQRQLDDLVRAE